MIQNADKFVSMCCISAKQIGVLNSAGAESFRWGSSGEPAWDDDMRFLT